MDNSESVVETVRKTNGTSDLVDCQLTKRVKNGAHHTIVLELNKSFTLTKSFWDEIALERLEEACNVHNRAEVLCDKTNSLQMQVAALLITEGLANLCLLTDSMTVTVAQFSVAIPRKRVGSQKHHDAALERYSTSFVLTVDN